MAVEPINVLDYGAGVPGGDDAAAFQSAIDAAHDAGKLRGTASAIYIPPGQYRVARPVILPRTGSRPHGGVAVLGHSMASTTVTGTTTFPEERAIFEWDSTPTRAWCQEISGLTIRLPDVPGARAIWYRRHLAGTTLEDYNAERFQIDLKSLSLEGHNGFHESLVRLEGQVFHSLFWRVWADNRLTGLDKGHPPITDHDTVTLDFDTGAPGSAGSDICGLSYSEIHDCRGATTRRGGRGSLVRGKLKAVSIRASFCDGGREVPGIDLSNSFNVTLSHVNNEGRTAPQIRLKDSEMISIADCYISSQDPAFPDWKPNTRWSEREGAITPGWRSNTTHAPPVHNAWFQCVQAGVTGAHQPAWPATPGERVQDGTVVWERVGPAVEDAVIVDGGSNIHFTNVGTSDGKPNFSSRGGKMIRLTNGPMHVSATRCSCPGDPNDEIAWDTDLGVGEFYSVRTGVHRALGGAPENQ